jgi:2-polyprenyl-6-methoxyphenol hydroxylase-like FAD-dependent oxidoreductase
MALTAANVLAEELDSDGDVSGALARYEQRLKPTSERQQEAGRRTAKWFVPDDEPHRIVRDLVKRMATWPGVSEPLRRWMAVKSSLGHVP